MNAGGIHLRRTMQWVDDTHMHYEMMTTMQLIDMSITSLTSHGCRRPAPPPPTFLYGGNT